MNRRDFLKTVGIGAAALALPNIVVAEPAPIQPSITPREIVFPTGMSHLDRALDGGFRPGQLTVVLGRTGSGKTAFCNTAYLANQKTCSARHEVSTGLGYLQSGSYDLLHLHDNHTFMAADVDLENYINRIYTDQPLWSRLHSFSRRLKQSAMDANEAIVWTIPSNRDFHRFSTHSVMRCADHVMLLVRPKPYLYIIKNRYGRRATIPIKIEPGAIWTEKTISS